MGRGLRDRVGEHGQHERLGVPERVAVVAVPGQALRRDGPALRAGTGLQHVEHAEAGRLLDLLVPLQLHIGPGPEIVQVGPLLLGEALPAGLRGDRERALHLVLQGRPGARARPAVGHELHQPERLPGLEPGAHGEPGQVRPGLGPGVGVRVAGHRVLHGGRHRQVAVLGPVHQPGPAGRGAEFHRLQRRLEHRGDPGVAAAGRQLLVGDQLGLHHHADRVVQRLDLVADGRDRALGQRDQPDRADPDPAPGRRHPVRPPGQRAGPEVQHPLMLQQLAVADVERLVVDEQPDQLPVGDVDHRLAGLREAEAGLGVGQRAPLVHAVQVGPREAVRLPLVQVRPPPDVPVGQREHGFGLGQHVGVQRAFPQAPRLDRERGVLDHRSSSSSARSRTTTSAPALPAAAGLPAGRSPGPAGTSGSRRPAASRPRTS